MDQAPQSSCRTAYTGCRIKKPRRPAVTLDLPWRPVRALGVETRRGTPEHVNNVAAPAGRRTNLIEGSLS